MSRRVAQRRICVIGAGTAGIVATKTALQEGDGAEVVCYERSESLGGIWWYRRDETEQTTVMEFTVTNTSKEMSAFSDYPPSADLPAYLPHRLMLSYLKEYADNFGVTQCIQFNHVVYKVEKLPTAQWQVTVEDRGRDSGCYRTEKFDAVMVCVGHHCIPKMPEFQDRQLFKGRIIHAKNYKNSDGYRGKTVLVVGFGNSAADVAVSLVGLADQVYASVRRGTWIVPSHTSGTPSDFLLFRRVNFAVPRVIGNYFLHKHLRQAFDQDIVGFNPEHAASSQQGTVNDLLPKALLSKQIILQPPIDRFTENGVIFQNSDQEVAVDEVVVATGYRADIPFVDNRLFGKLNRSADVERLLLYKGLYSLTEDSIAFLGMVEAVGNLGQVFEMQARHAMAVFNGKYKLIASESLRRSVVEKDIVDIKSKYVSGSDRHSAMVNKIEYMDMLAEDIQVKPDWWALLRTEPYLVYKSIFGPLLPYQYRLVGPFSWQGARDAIFTAHQRQFGSLRPRRALPRTKSPSTIGASALFIIFALLFFYIVIKFS